MSRSVISMILVKTETKVTTLEDIYTQDTAVEQGVIKMSEIVVPSYETKYAELTCDAVNLSAPVYYGDSDTVFEQGVGQYLGSYLPGMGRTILLGAHDNTFFAPLESMEPGMEITIKTSYGVFTYQVTKTWITEENDASAYSLGQKKEQLILYTCYPFGTYIGVKDQRFIVYADKISGPTIVEEEKDE